MIRVVIGLSGFVRADIVRRSARRLRRILFILVDGRQSGTMPDVVANQATIRLRRHRRESLTRSLCLDVMGHLHVNR